MTARWSLLLALALGQVSPRASERYERSIAARQPGPACAVLDPAIFPHAAPALKDLRLMAGAREVPYAITRSQPIEAGVETARFFNVVRGVHTLSFDLGMPGRRYTAVELDLSGFGFIAQATVTGKISLDNADGQPLGRFTLFDLSNLGLGRSMTLPLEETSLPFLHVDLELAPAPGMRSFAASQMQILSVSVPPSRQAQTVFIPIATTGDIARENGSSVARFQAPARVPIEHVSVSLTGAYAGNFNRQVQVIARANQPGSLTETAVGTIQRVRMKSATGDIDTRQLDFDLGLGANLQRGATVEVRIGGAPLPIESVSLAMRERRICFDAPGDALLLLYGDPELASPAYAYAREFTPAQQAGVARLGPESMNPAFDSRRQDSWVSRTGLLGRPELAWIVALGLLGVLGTMGLRTLRQRRQGDGR